jgi:hypothetical protein
MAPKGHYIQGQTDVSFSKNRGIVQSLKSESKFVVRLQNRGSNAIAPKKKHERQRCFSNTFGRVLFFCVSLFTRAPPVCIHSCTPIHTPSYDSNNSEDVDGLAMLLAA